jgi:hypothetical protein
MTTLTHSFRPFLAPRCPALSTIASTGAPTEAQERRVLFGAAVLFLVGGAFLVLHALSTVTAFS